MKMGTEQVVKYYQSRMGTWVLPSLSLGIWGSSRCAKLSPRACCSTMRVWAGTRSPRRCRGLPFSLHMSPNLPGYHPWLCTAAWGRGRLPSAPTTHGGKSLSFTMMHFKDSHGSWGKSSYQLSQGSLALLLNLSPSPASLCKSETPLLFFQKHDPA